MIYMATLAYCPVIQIAKLIPRWHSTFGYNFFRGDVKHILINRGYPQHNYDFHLRKLARVYGCEVVHPPTELGAHQAMSWTIKHMKLKPNDIWIWVDSDSNPITKGWGDVLVEDVKRVNGCVVLWNQDATDFKSTLRSHPKHPHLWNQTRLCFIRMNAMTGEVLNKIGDITSEDPKLLYGFIELPLRDKLRANGWDIWYTERAKEGKQNQNFYDPLYAEWKVQHAHKREFYGDFADFKRRRSLIVELPSPDTALTNNIKKPV